jgi:hypothetical protein
MAWIAGALITSSLIGVGSSLYGAKKAKKAQKKAEKDALNDRRKADEEELFSKTEGEGLGQLGQVSLDVDDEEEDDKISNTLSI